MTGELDMPTVVVLHEGKVDPALIAVKSGIKIPSTILSFTSTYPNLNMYNANIGDVAFGVDQLLIEDTVYENYGVDCSDAIIGLRSSLKPCSARIFNSGSGVCQLLFSIKTSRLSFGAEITGGAEAMK